MPPADITITNISQTTADISWTASATPGATQYEYEVRTSGAPGSGTAGLDATGTVTGLTANVTGLSASMEYSVYVRSRSEEHTSELQSRPHLVCRLLLEKKKK